MMLCTKYEVRHAFACTIFMHVKIAILTILVDLADFLYYMFWQKFFFRFLKFDCWCYTVVVTCLQLLGSVTVVGEHHRLCLCLPCGLASPLIIAIFEIPGWDGN